MVPTTTVSAAVAAVFPANPFALPPVYTNWPILKSDAKYTEEEYNSIKQLYEEYNSNMQLFLKGVKKNDSQKEERDAFISQMIEEFSNACYAVCPDGEVLANVIVDVCYTTSKNKSFAWEVAGEEIFNNVLKNNGYILNIPVKDDDGDIEFGGGRFSLLTTQIGGDIDVDFE